MECSTFCGCLTAALCDARIDSRGIKRYRRTETAANQPDAPSGDLRSRQQAIQRALRVLDLLQTNDVTERPFALAAATHIEAQRNVTPVTEHTRGIDDVTGIFIAAETVQHDKGRTGMTFLKAVGNLQDGR